MAARRRNQHVDALGHLNPFSDIPDTHVSAQAGDELKEEELVILADDLYKLDSIILYTIGGAQYSIKYIEDISFLKYWREYRPPVTSSVPRDGQPKEVNKGLAHYLGDFRDAAHALSQNLVTAAGHGFVNKGMIASIGRRLRYVDEILGIFKAAWKEVILLGTLPETLMKVKEVRSEQGDLEHKEANPGNLLSNLVAITGIAVFLSLIPLPFARSRSTSKPGIPKNSDFWWLIQSCIMQLLSIITLAVPISQGSELPLQNWIWTWCFIAIAVVATLLAVPLYVLVPVPYSSIDVFTAAVAQAFVFLQVCLASTGLATSPKKKAQ